MKQAGAMRDRIAVLRTTFDEDANRYEYTLDRWLWAEAEQTEKTTIFSKVGIGARGVTFRMRLCRELTLHNAFLWHGKHCFLTSILPDGRQHMTVQAALVEPVLCRAGVDDAEPGAWFTGFLTEKYMRYEQGAPLAINEITYVLVTPKKVELQRGSLVEIGGRDYNVDLAHILDPYKNEYECRRVEDL